MACYNHEILVQYLRDVYSMELLRNKVQSQLSSLNTRIENDKCMISLFQQKSFPISQDVEEPSFGGIFVLWIVPLIICIFLTVILVDIPIIGFLFPYVCTLAGLFWTAITLGSYPYEVKSYKESSKKAQEDFKFKVSDYENQQSRASACQADLNQIIPTYNNTLAQLQEIKQNLTDAYSVNIIPNRYRTIYYAYYLYDYFSSCQETDLDKIIQTMLLDQIIAKLNQIIAQQTETILNQRMILAKQDAQMEALQENHNAHLRSLAQIEQNQALQTNYLDMLDTNTRITNFFVTADYINKYL